MFLSQIWSAIVKYEKDCFKKNVGIGSHSDCSTIFGGRNPDMAVNDC